MMEALEPMLETCGIEFKATEHYIRYGTRPSGIKLMDLTPSLYRCFPHLVNVAVQTIIKMITDVSLGHEDAVFNGILSAHATTFSEALACDPIVCAHAIARACHTSGQHWEQLSQIIIEGNANNTFSHVTLPFKSVTSPSCMMWTLTGTQFIS